MWNTAKLIIRNSTVNSLQKKDENYFLKGEIRSFCYQTFF